MTTINLPNPDACQTQDIRQVVHAINGLTAAVVTLVEAVQRPRQAAPPTADAPPPEPPHNHKTLAITFERGECPGCDWRHDHQGGQA